MTKNIQPIRSKLTITGYTKPEPKELDIDARDVMEMIRKQIMLRFLAPEEAQIRIVDGLPTWCWVRTNSWKVGEEDISPIKYQKNARYQHAAGQRLDMTAAREGEPVRYATPQEVEIMAAIKTLTDYYQYNEDHQFYL